jgi:4'-phosphopantetheinyl transferase
MIELDAQVDVLPSVGPARRRDAGEGPRPHGSMGATPSARLLPPACEIVRFESAPDLQVWSSTGNGAAAGEDRGILDVTELARADRLRFEHDRLRFVHAHAFTRRVLAAYLGISPAAIRFHATPLGKPFVEGRPDVSFSLSHSGDAVVVAVVRGSDIGVDIEGLRQVDDALDVARGQFSSREWAALAEVAPGARSAAFLALWTRKEAVVKTCGAGLSVPLASFDVLDARGALTGPCRVQVAGATSTVGAFDAPDGYVGSVAVSHDRAVPGRGPSR